MTVQQIIDKLDELTRVHMDLLKLSKEQTEVVKQSDIKSFAAIIAKERKLIQLVERIEAKRAELVRAYLGGKEGTLADCLKKATIQEAELLAEGGSHLMEIIAELKVQNELNRQLVQQSLQFVNMNMDLFLPEEDTYTYERPEQTRESRAGRSLFDSRA